MNKTLSLIKLMTLCLFLSACTENIPLLDECVLPSEVSENEPANGEDPPRVCNALTPLNDNNIEINAVLNDFSIEKEKKMQKALRRLKLVLNSQEFKNRVLEHEYQGVKIFVDNQGLSNEEVYDNLMLAAETLVPEEDGELDLDITLYYSNNSTVGYTYPNVIGFWVNDKFFSTYTLGKVAANVVHEWTHKMGFDHDFNRTSRRNYSVPYGVGKIVEELIDSL